MKNILEWFIAFVIVTSLIIILPLATYIVATWAVYGLTVLIGGY